MILSTGPGRAPTICLVTDRRRADPLAQVHDAAAARIELFQVRERDLDARPLAALVRELVAATRGSATRLIVNDRLDVALACGADGVHLRADSMSIGDARRLAPAGFLIGRSVHSVEEAAVAFSADYLIAGTVFRTSSKPAQTACLGERGLAAIVRAASAPVLAIGGVSADTVDAVARAGAAGVAAIGLFSTPSDIAPAASALRTRFDSAKAAP